MRIPKTEILLIIILLMLSFISMKYALANFYFERAKTSYLQLNGNELEYSYELNPIVDDLEHSLSLRSNSADALDLKADLLYQSWWLSPDAQFLPDSALLQNALELHAEADKYRLGWAFSAARRALIYSNQGNLDNDFDKWFVESHRLGLYEQSLSRSLMILSLQNWKRLTETQKVIALDFIRTSIEQKPNSPERIALLLQKYAQYDDVCHRLRSTPRKDRVCQNIKPS